MTATMTLAQRVDALEFDVAIKELRSKYCWYAARDEVAAWRALSGTNAADHPSESVTTTNA